MIKTIYIERKELIKFDKHWSDHRSSHTKHSQILLIQVAFLIIQAKVTKFQQKRGSDHAALEQHYLD